MKPGEGEPVPSDEVPIVVQEVTGHLLQSQVRVMRLDGEPITPVHEADHRVGALLRRAQVIADEYERAAF
jgi:hypothetical protein